jgi:hypothetical protein
VCRCENCPWLPARYDAPRSLPRHGTRRPGY